METREKKTTIGRLWRLCPVRHTLLGLSLLWLGFYFCFRGNRALMNAICRIFVRPWHQTAGRLYSMAPFSVAQWVIVGWIIAGLAFAAQLVIHVVRNHSRGALYRWFISLLTMTMTIFGLFSLWWGVYYYSDSFAEQAGLERRAISVEELESVTRYFAEMANEYSSQVQRDADGVFTADFRELFDRSETLYHAVEKDFPCLSGPDLRAKPVVFSRFMSWIDNTGFFFAYTAEANVNVDCPMALLPATIGHELAHQRGVAHEDEANFVGVLACMTGGDAAFQYSGALMAYVYLGNALHSTDYDVWLAVYESLNEDVQRDLRVHNAYWAQFDTPAADISNKVYEGFLRTYGDDRGMRSYDACVDLLVLYYLDAAQES